MAAQQKKTKKTTKTATTTTAPVTHLAFVVDRSGSMSGIRDQLVEIFNGQLAALKGLSKQSIHTIFVSFFTFHSEVDEPRLFAVSAAELGRLRGWACKGMTALHDASGMAIRALRSLPGADRQSTSFVVVVVTDGHENASKAYKTKLITMLSTAQKTGRWTFAFLVPQGGVAACGRLGIPAGNVHTWNPTSAGAAAMGRALSSSTKRFFAARARGERASTRVFLR